MELGVNLTGTVDTPTATGGPPDPLMTKTEIDYFASKGMTVLRIPMTWESLQPTLDGALDPAYLASLQQTVAYAASLGMKVILDLHNYGAYNGNLIGTSQTPISAFANVWGQLGAAFAGDSNVMFGLMNEPQLTSETTWLSAVNSAIGAIRSAGATKQEVLVSGLDWDSAENWTTDGNASVLGAPGAIVDPSHNYAFEVHQYLDTYGQGQTTEVASVQTGVQRLQSITAWAQQTGAKLFLGEVGVGADATSTTALQNMLAYMESNSGVWQGATYWAAGQNWNNYIYSVEPILGLLDTPQMSVLDEFSGATTTTTLLSDGTTSVSTNPGAGLPSMRQIMSSSGAVLSATLYAADGKVDRSVTENSDGTLTLSIFNDSGLSHPTTIDTYSSADVLLNQTIYQTDGSKTLTDFVPGTVDASMKYNYNAAGVLTSTVDYLANGNIEVQDFQAGDAHAISTTLYDSNWDVLQVTDYDTSGNTTQVTINSTNGTHKILVYANAGSSTPSQIQNYNSSWALTSLNDYNANNQLTTIINYQPNGQILERDFAPGNTHSPATKEVYDSNWNLQFRNTYNSAGLLTEKQVDLTNGGFLIDSFASPGAAYPSTKTFYNSAWAMTEQQSLNLAGQVTATQMA